ncbi:unnamed protein product [Musa acuminata subsp. malaccensis]|uniref:(wild Malaysian banana) hypothetical protein n=1 Tax=Musa acuminata subsp. malaccensis TaxID=214687 RepID=A0A804KR85_MUSAM|nr:unnamed protein product [Musa acuminata subsp. malaccensis]
MVNCSSCCTESQREAALLLGQFASADSDCKALCAYCSKRCCPPSDRDASVPRYSTSGNVCLCSWKAGPALLFLINFLTICLFY